MSESTTGGREGERRLPMALAVICAGVLYLFIPPDFRITEYAHVLFLTFLLVFLLILVIGDPGRIDRDRRWLRVTTGLMIGLITAMSVVSAARLVVGILDQANFTSPSQLLTIGSIVWITTIIAFALWFWHLDSGGPAARAAATVTTRPAFRFREQDISEIPTEWYPQFVDYLALSFNTATAFGPSDVSAIRHWAKLSMMIESAISLTLVALVVARAVNVL